MMSNHLYLVVKLSPEVVSERSDREVVHLWTGLFKGPLPIQKYVREEQAIAPSEQRIANSSIDTYRLRMENLGWFMKCLNEPVARMANRKDTCTGQLLGISLSVAGPINGRGTTELHGLCGP
jgi:hypothetical protein